MLDDDTLVAVWSGWQVNRDVLLRRFDLRGVSEDSVTGIATSRLLANDSDSNGDVLKVSAVSATSAMGAELRLVDADNDGVFDRIDYDPRHAAAV